LPLLNLAFKAASSALLKSLVSETVVPLPPTFALITLPFDLQQN